MYTVIAIIPDSGPSPIRITKNIAQIMLGRLLEAANIARAGYDTHGEVRFLAASKAIGSETSIPKTVDTNAIFKVSIIPIHAVEQVNWKPGADSQGG